MKINNCRGELTDISAGSTAHQACGRSLLDRVIYARHPCLLLQSKAGLEHVERLQPFLVLLSQLSLLLLQRGRESLRLLFPSLHHLKALEDCLYMYVSLRRYKNACACTSLLSTTWKHSRIVCTCTSRCDDTKMRAPALPYLTQPESTRGLFVQVHLTTTIQNC